jgi:integrase
VLKDGKIVNLKGRVFLDDEGEPLTGQDLDRRWRAVRAAAGLKSTKDKTADGTGFRWHDFRHSCASFLAQNGSSLIEIGSVLGHKSPSVTAKYAHLTVGKAVTGHEALNSKLEGA